MATSQQILSNLRVLIETSHSLDLQIQFAGAPFRCQSNIVELAHDQVVLETDSPLIAGLSTGDQVTVLCEHYFIPALASVVAVDIPNKVLTLGSFTNVVMRSIEAANSGAASSGAASIGAASIGAASSGALSGGKLESIAVNSERAIPRFVPKGQVGIDLDNQGQICSGFLADISIYGAGVRLAHADYQPTLKPGTELTLTIKLPKGNVSVKGTILSVRKTLDQYRLSIRFEPDYKHKRQVFEYLVERHAEIQARLDGYAQTAERKAGER